MKKKFSFEDLLTLIFKILGIAFLLSILGIGFYFVGYLWKLIIGI